MSNKKLQNNEKVHYDYFYCNYFCRYSICPRGRNFHTCRITHLNLPTISRGWRHIYVTYHTLFGGRIVGSVEDAILRKGIWEYSTCIRVYFGSNGIIPSLYIITTSSRCFCGCDLWQRKSSSHCTHLELYRIYHFPYNTHNTETKNHLIPNNQLFLLYKLSPSHYRWA